MLQNINYRLHFGLMIYAFFQIFSQYNLMHTRVGVEFLLTKITRNRVKVEMRRRNVRP